MYIRCSLAASRLGDSPQRVYDRRPTSVFRLILHRLRALSSWDNSSPAFPETFSVHFLFYSDSLRIFACITANIIMNPAETSFRQRQYTQFSNHISDLLAEESTSSKAEKLLALFESNYDDDSDAESQISYSEDGIRPDVGPGFVMSNNVMPCLLLPWNALLLNCTEFLAAFAEN